MASGYTYQVKSGEIQDFPTFALRCARAFGALIEMRDDPLDADIPEESPLREFYQSWLNDARAELQRLKDMSTDEIAAEVRAENDAAVRRWAEHQEKVEIERLRYEAMLEQVRSWVPPTPKHEELKTFMREQLEESIRFDCRPEPQPRAKTPEEWYMAMLQRAQCLVDNYARKAQEERELATERTQWVRDLRASLSKLPR